jgi:hypothetical protein
MWERMKIWWSWTRRETREADLERELHAHLDLEAEERREAGLSPQEAAYAARRALGNTVQIKEDVRMAWGFPWLETLLQDLRYGLRQLRRNPGFTVVAVLTLALGIGANTAIFSLVNTVLLHPLPYVDSGRIVDIFRRDNTLDSAPMFSFWQQNNPCIDDLAAYVARASSVNLRGSDKPEMVQELKVSANYFRLFGAAPILGRTFTVEEDRPGDRLVLVMSYGLWQRLFGGDPAILGKAITLGGASYTIVGIMAPRFKLYPPLMFGSHFKPIRIARTKRTSSVSGRLRSGTTLVKANSEVEVVADDTGRLIPNSWAMTTTSLKLSRCRKT